jgi:dephospho-CoA kinase
MLTIGLTGGIASGKSTVQAMFETLGAPVLDADQVARQVVEPGSVALAQIAAAFGPQMLLADGSLDRRRMREHVFGRPGELRRLEAITHPQIRRRMLDWKAVQTAPYCMLSVAILIEARMHDLVERVLVVDVPETLQRGVSCFFSVSPSCPPLLSSPPATASTRPWPRACCRRSCRARSAWRRPTTCWKTVAIWIASGLRSRFWTGSIADSQPPGRRARPDFVCPSP